MKNLTDENDVDEKHEADDTKRDEFQVFQVREAVGDGAAENDNVGIEEYGVAGPAMNLTQDRCSFFLGPRLITIVAALESDYKSSTNYCYERAYDTNEA